MDTRRHSITFRGLRGALSLGRRIRVRDLYTISSFLLLNVLIAVGVNFGVLFAWVVISCITLPVFQWYIRRNEEQLKTRVSESLGKPHC